MCWGGVLRLKCLLSGTIHIAVGCHRFNVVVCVKQWVISLQEKEFISELSQRVSSLRITPKLQKQKK